MFKGILKFIEGSKFKAFLIFRECWKVYRKYEQELEYSNDDNLLDPDFRSRLLLGLGLFYLIVSFLPKSLSALISIFGFIGNKEKGKLFL